MHTPEPMSGTILVIDRDERLPQERSVFEGAGFTVVTANSVEQGLALAKQQTPDLVVSEVMLDKPDAGFVLGYRMRQNPALAEVPLVLISSVFQRTGTIFDLSTPSGRQWIKADAYLERPVPPERLIAKVRGLLKHNPHHETN